MMIIDYGEADDGDYKSQGLSSWSALLRVRGDKIVMVVIRSAC